MEIKGATYKVKGMNKDLSYSTFNKEYSYHNKNIRLTARDGNNLLSITNEKGNLLLNTSTSVIHGKVLGSCTINNYIVLFTKDASYNYIYRVLVSGTTGTIKELFKGNLSFSLSNKIQSLPFYENDDIQKVYWIDGINQPRVINIKDETSTYNNTSFDFSQILSLNESISVQKYFSGGSFKSGVLQYAFTYFNKNGVETQIFKSSNILNISQEDRAGKIDEVIGNSFKITISNIDNNFDYIRIYSIHRTSIDTTPEVKNVIDINIQNKTSVSYTDNGATCSSVASDVLLYLGSSDITPQCMNQKNNTLFFGNIKLNDKILDIYKLQESDYTFSWINSSNYFDFEKLEGLSPDKFYPYRPNSLNSHSNEIKHFKFDETYRLGIQGQYSNGKWSTPVYIGLDKKVDKRYICSYDNNIIKVKPTYGNLVLNSSISNTLISKGFVNIRPVMVPLSYSDRSIVAQGICTNTLSIIKDRHTDNIASTEYARPDYLTRPTNWLKNGECLRINMGAYDDLRVENVGTGKDGYYDGCSQTVDTNTDIYDAFWSTNNKYSENEAWFSDTNFVNFWSPDIIYNYENIKTSIEQSNKIGLYGNVVWTGHNYTIAIDTNKTGGNVNKLNNSIVDNYDVSNSSYITSELDSTPYGYMYDDGYDKRAYCTYPMWGPSSYHFDNGANNETHGGFRVDNVFFDFTRYDRYNMVYFGVNSILNNSYRYELPINKPSLVYQSGENLISSNIDDNNGNVIYNKKVVKNYVSGAFYHKMHMEAGGNSQWWMKKSDTSMFINYTSNTHLSFTLSNVSKIKDMSLITATQCLPRFNYSSVNDLDEYSSTYPYWRTQTLFYNKTIAGNNFQLCGIPDLVMNNRVISIFDIYKDVDDSSRYGGVGDEAIFENTWIPAGDTTKLVNDTSNTILFNSGDTYIQRFDFLKTYTEDSTQIPNHNEAISFICESFMNLDGRCDSNRYSRNINLVTTSNYGLLNNVYSQKDNYFTYNILDPSRFNQSLFNNTITWSKVKIAGELTDTWTNISMLSTLDLEGVNGGIKSINLWNNELYAFQPKAIARLLYNERVQQAASDGVSIELINGYTVPGCRYLTNQYGCDDKWSIIEGKGGIYFIDKINKSFNLLSNGIQDLSNQFGFKSWFNANIDQDFTLSYDKSNKDVYIQSKDYCFNFSETLSSFESFYDYIDKPQMQNINNDFFSIYYDTTSELSTIWLNNKGEYNKFYGEIKPFSVEYIINPEPLSDKVFNTFDYRLDNDDINWNYLNVETYYQSGLLTPVKFESNHKKKFNVHRVQIPRRYDFVANKQTLDRIRATWMKLKLSRTFDDENINKKFSQQDLTVWYTI